MTGALFYCFFEFAANTFEDNYAVVIAGSLMISFAYVDNVRCVAATNNAKP